MPTSEACFKFPIVETQYDICFIGRDKGRYPEIKNLYSGGVYCSYRIALNG